jgi:alpha-tubulin suppressor-like RCC1 family protein
MTTALHRRRALDCGDFATCVLATDGYVRCWGRNKDGELGVPAQEESVKRVRVPGLGPATSIAMASQMSCALMKDKHVKCWGSGHLGTKSIANGPPTEVDGIDDAEEIEASGAIVCARGPKGIRCFGEDSKSIGTPPDGTSFKQIATGFTHGCAIDDKGAVACWGQNDWAPSGRYAKPGIAGAVQIVTGDRHACVIAKDKTVQCWGMNDSGQLGAKPDFVPHPKPVAVPGLKNVTKLFTGEAATCAISSDGATKCWGANSEGELGTGTPSGDERPVSPSGVSNVDQICFASAHSCVLTKEQKLYCWGSKNNFGQLGDGTKEPHITAAPVAW